ncbi:thioredoxin [Magnaporthiopsis poae ATCC 64411]|uniref:Thioredoxin n=1 Tax=Magnaporthiopsis poae (strain ATCC 64411 / 73-15) TaxID=644358 RepID=A0A0C4DP80_MAGP6|nr:thioredoxin [Magnaporthiopsis poae ATCC 64411]
MSRLIRSIILPTTKTILARPSVTTTQRLLAARRPTTAAAAAAKTPFARATQAPIRGFRSTPANMTVQAVKTEEEFKDAIAKHKVVLVDFFATWCGPCKAISPMVEKWSDKYPNIHYVKVDVDELPVVSQEYGVRAMPTFLLFTDGEKTNEVVGAIPPKLEALITENHPASA